MFGIAGAVNAGTMSLLMIINASDTGAACCNVCKKDFKGYDSIVSVISNPEAKDVFWIGQDYHLIEIRNATKHVLFHKDCFDLIAGEDWCIRD